MSISTFSKKDALFKSLATLSLLVYFSMLPSPAFAAKKQPAKKSGGGGSGGSAYPQCKFGGNKIVHWIPQEMPLKVYISKGLCLDNAGTVPETGGPISNVDNTAGWPDLVYQLAKNPDGFNGLAVADAYNDQMWQAAAQGINQWKRFQQEGLYSFELTNDPQEANVFVFWTNHFVNKMGLALFANDIRGYTAKHLLPYTSVINAMNAGNNELIERSLRPVVVILRTTDSTNVPMPLGKLVASSAHEMGHVLGIDGHSTNPTDLMSVYYGRGTISANDAATIRYIYHCNPDLLP